MKYYTFYIDEPAEGGSAPVYRSIQEAMTAARSCCISRAKSITFCELVFQNPVMQELVWQSKLDGPTS